MNCKVHPEVINLVPNKYTDDLTNIFLNETKQTLINITDGRRQGCNASMFLFTILTYEIITELEIMDEGFKKEYLKIPILYADDSLLVSQVTLSIALLESK